jgi:quinolinate synthase
MIGAAKATLGERLFILGHHYQRDEVMKWADARGDSYRLSVLAQERPEADYIVFCGVHFMAESADVLTGDHQAVVLPDLNAGCSMADMADIDSVTEAWDALGEVIDTSELVPITYMNSSAALKAFVGATAVPCAPPPTPARSSSGPSPGAARCCSSPTSTWAATPASPWATPTTTCGCGTRGSSWAGSPRTTCARLTFLLWKGHCSVHQRFTPAHVEAFRAEHPDGIVVAHPECAHEVCAIADQVGSTDFIIKAVAAAPWGPPSPSAPRSTW